jgi:hypothetical protein
MKAGDLAIVAVSLLVVISGNISEAKITFLNVCFPPAKLPYGWIQLERLLPTAISTGRRNTSFSKVRVQVLHRPVEAAVGSSRPSWNQPYGSFAGESRRSKR